MQRERVEMVGRNGEKKPSPLVILLAEVFTECVGNRTMLAQMQESIVSLIYKEKGERCNLKYYRPIAVSSVIYRILAKTLIISMRDVLPTVVSNCQKAFQQNKFITDCTRMIQDVMEYCDREGEEGFLLFCDQDAAYPRVEWDFIFKVLQEMNFHPDLVRTVEMMYSGIKLRFKVNSVVDSTVAKPTNGLAQGCPLSPVLTCFTCFTCRLSSHSLTPRTP